jgi:ribonuclease E
MTKKMLIDASHPEETRVAVVNKGKVEDFDFESQSRRPLRGNIYLARVTRIEPSLQAAFVEYGGNRHGFLAFSEIHSDYYQIPVADREILRKAEELESQLAAELEQSVKDLDDEEDARAEASDDDADSEDDSAAEEIETVTSDDSDDEDNGETEPAELDAVAENTDDVSDENGEREQESQQEEDGPEETSLEETEDGSDTDIEASDESNGEADSDDTQAPDLGEEEGIGARDRAAMLAEAEQEVSVAISGKQSEAAKRLADLQDRYRQAKRDRSNLLRNYRIQEVVKRRQVLLIQVVKEERGNKGAALTTYLSLAGRYCVLMPNTARGGGISRKIANSSDRKRLRRAMEDLEIPQGIGLIIRTAGAKRTKAEIKRDYDYLLRLWQNIRDLTLKSIAPSLIYEEANLIKRSIRDLYDKDIETVLVEGESGYREAKDFMKMLMPSHAKHVQRYKDKVPLFIQHKVEHQLDEMYQPVVKLKSGGYLVIQQTEALVSIDVNSGKSTRERNIEATALKTNQEAAREVARQCRLRDLAGLVVVDFIDMEENRNNRAVEKRLKDAMKNDRARIQLGRISGFGLLEFSRQRRRSGIVDGTTQVCPSCHGAGVVRSDETAALRILRALEDECIRGKTGQIAAKTSTDVALFILNNKRDWLRRIEETYGVSVAIIADPEKAGDSFEVTHMGEPRKARASNAVVRADQPEFSDDDVEEAQAEKPSDDEAEEESKPKRRRQRRPRRRNRDERSEGDEASADSANADAANSNTVNSSAESDSEEKSSSETQDGDEEEKSAKRSRRRGRRGGRRNRRRPDSSEGESAEASDNQDTDSKIAEPMADDQTADAKPADNGADNGEEQPASKPKPKRKRRARKSVKETKAPAETSVSDAPSKPVSEPAPQIVKEPANEAPIANDVSQESAAVTSEEDKPRKRGWWSRALKGS